MIKVRFGHIADIHLASSYPQGGLERLEEIKHRAIKAFKFMIKKGVEFILIAGDVFDNPRPGENERIAFAEIMEPIIVNGIPTIIIPGQHDKVTDKMHAHLGIRALLEITEVGKFVYFADRFDVVEIHSAVDVICQPWERNIDLRLWREALNNSNAEYKVLLGHFGVKGGRVGPKNYKIEEGIPNSAFKGFDYVALGDFHKAQKYYSGSLSRLKFEDMAEEKGFKIVDFFEDAKTKVRFVPMPDRTFISTNFYWEEWEGKGEEDINVCLKDNLDVLSEQDLKDCNLKLIAHLPDDVALLVDEVAIRKHAIGLGVNHFTFEWRQTKKEYEFTRLESVPEDEDELIDMDSMDLLRTYINEKWKGPGKKRVSEEGAKLLI